MDDFPKFPVTVCRSPIYSLDANRPILRQDFFLSSDVLNSTLADRALRGHGSLLDLTQGLPKAELFSSGMVRIYLAATRSFPNQKLKSQIYRQHHYYRPPEFHGIGKVVKIVPPSPSRVRSQSTSSGQTQPHWPTAGAEHHCRR